MKALIYARVSSDPRGIGRSVAEQEAECRALCDREGWTVTDVLVDNDRSASRHGRKDRPAWAEAHKRIASRSVDVLVTWEASRAQRDVAAYIELRQLCVEAGVKWCSSGRLYDLDDGDDRFRTLIDAAIAERDAEDIRKRVLRAMRSNAQGGKPHGRRLFGYRRMYDIETGVLLGQEPDPDEAALVTEAAQRFLAGESASSIAADYVQRDIPGAWDLGRVRRMLTNPAYAGRRVHLGDTVPANWPAILDDDTFRSLEARFTDPSRAKFRAGPNAHLLSGVARCGVCGGPMTYTLHAPRGKPRRSKYICRHKHCTGRDLETLDAYVTTVVLDRLARPDATDIVEDHDDDVQAALADVVELRQRLQSATDEFTAGRLTSATLGHVEASLLPQIGDAERRARIVSLPTVAHDLAVADDPATVWDALAVEQRREIVRALVDVIVDRVTVRGRNGFDPASVRTEWRR